MTCGNCNANMEYFKARNKWICRKCGFELQHNLLKGKYRITNIGAGKNPKVLGG